jgi:hypothetical protein
MTNKTIQAEDAHQFKRWLAERYVQRARISMSEASDYAAEQYHEIIVRGDVVFGASDWDWTREGANAMADEDMACWSDD